MSNPQVIPTNFRVPKGYRHEFVIFRGNKAVCSIYGIPGRKEIALASINNPDPKNEKAVMDWMAESIEHIRAICKRP